MKLRLLFVLPMLIVPGAASAQSVQLLGEFRDWSAFSASEGTGALCFAMAKSTIVEPTPDGFTDAYLYLTHRPTDGVANEINLVAGFEFAPDQPAVLTISGQSFGLFTQKDAAWLLDPKQADSLAGAMRAGSSLTIEGTNVGGVKVTETFSLSGATAASRAIDGGC
ncbi:MAG: invasion associated locus B family protein [Devosia sp.]